MYFNILSQLKSPISHSRKIVIYAVVFETWLITVNIIFFLGVGNCATIIFLGVG
jgi:hypothetical protein